jgi:hypothetical protein
MKTIILHCQKWEWKYNKTGPAIKNNIGKPWTITTQVNNLDSETIGNAIYIAAVNGQINHFDDVDKVTHNGNSLKFTFNFCIDLAEAGM